MPENGLGTYVVYFFILDRSEFHKTNILLKLFGIFEGYCVREEMGWGGEGGKGGDGVCRSTLQQML